MSKVDERFKELIEEMYSQPLQIERFPTIKEAVEKLCEELKSDIDYYRSWQANIAMAFFDQFREDCPETYSLDILKVANKAANKAADNFLKLLISK